MTVLLKKLNAAQSATSRTTSRASNTKTNIATSATSAATSIALRLVDAKRLPAALKAAPAATRRWLQDTGFKALAHSHALVPGAAGEVTEVWVGIGDSSDAHALSALPMTLPMGRYHLMPGLAPNGLTLDDERAALSWALVAMPMTAIGRAHGRRPPCSWHPAPAPGADCTWRKSSWPPAI